jgi:hypothetical protein
MALFVDDIDVGLGSIGLLGKKKSGRSLGSQKPNKAIHTLYQPLRIKHLVRLMLRLNLTQHEQKNGKTHYPHRIYRSANQRAHGRKCNFAQKRTLLITETYILGAE